MMARSATKPARHSLRTKHVDRDESSPERLSEGQDDEDDAGDDDVRGQHKQQPRYPLRRLQQDQEVEEGVKGMEEGQERQASLDQLADQLRAAAQGSKQSRQRVKNH